MNHYQTHIVQIGNSKGIRIPKEFLAFLGTDDVELEYTKGGILIKPLIHTVPRSEWVKILSKMAIDKKEDELQDWDITLNDGIEDT